MRPAFVELSDLYHESRYRCRPSIPCENPGQCDGRQDTEVSDVVPSGHLYLGPDMGLSDKLLVDLKPGYSMVGGIEDQVCVP